MTRTPSRLKFLGIPILPRSTIERGSESCALSDPVSKFREVQQPWRSFSPKVLLEFDKLFEVRLLIIPELNDQDLVLQQMAEWLSRLSTDIRIKLIGFRRHGLHPEHSDFAEATPERLEDVHVVFQSYGYQDIQVI
ncbi:MAG: hypothetical protein MK481_04650 [SAR324 cluster bacterium]|nr:hypothetical protein [SAR324 cluster bacterium]